ncbi:MAG: carboxypeptidase-like regulatory domain-containing protein [Cyclobacteriaceae bacterium]
MSKSKNDIDKKQLLEYLSGPKKGKPANEIERKALDDPFLKEAIQGFEGMDTAEIEQDLKFLQSQTVKGPRNKWWLSIAASVGLLLISTGIIWYLVIPADTDTSIALNENSESKMEKEEPIEEIVLPDPSEQKEEIINPPVSTPTLPAINDNDDSENEETHEAGPSVNDEEIELLENIAMQDETEKYQQDDHAKPLSPVTTAAQSARTSGNGLIAKTEIQPLTDVIIGQVSDSDGLPIPGVNIIQKGTTRGTISDMEGNYRIRLSPTDSAVLTYSFIGYESQELKVEHSTSQNVVLSPDIESLSEVVVVRYAQKTSSEGFSSYEAAKPLGGYSAFEEFVADNIVTNNDLKNSKVVLWVYLSSDGSIEDIEVRRSVNETLDKEAERLVRTFKGWTPAKRNGQNISSKVRVKIKF